MLAFAVATCAPPQAQYDIRRGDLSCDEANRYAFQSMRSLGFVESRFEPAVPGREGVVKGTRSEISRSGHEFTRVGVVRIKCEPNEVLVTADEQKLMSQDLTFTRGFFLAFTGLVDHSGASKAYADEQAGGVTSGGVKFKIQPQLGLESKLDFGEDLAAGGVLAVKVIVQNGSSITYRLDPSGIELRPASGEGRVSQVSLPMAATAIAKAAAADAGEGAPPPDPGRIEATLRARALGARKLKPGDQAEGFVYFPTGQYARARATLIDDETGEGEGFLVEF